MDDFTSKPTQQAGGMVPPHSLESEQAILGALLIDPDAIIQVGDVLQPDDFYADKHRILYDTMLELFGRREPIDVLSVSGKLDDKNLLQDIGGRAYLADLSAKVPTSSNANFYAKIVKQKSTLRKLIRAGTSIAQLGIQEDQDVEKLLDQAEQTLFTVSQESLQQNYVPLHSILTDTFNRLDDIHKSEGQLRGVSTGYKDLDNLLGGFQKSDLIILAARPSMGKTGLALDIARTVAVQQKVPVGIVSLEMSKDQLGDRLLCAEAGIDLWKMRTGKLQQDEDFSKIGRAMGALAEAPLFIDDSANANIMEVRTKARRLQMEHGIGILIIDYLQLMEGRNKNGDNRVQEISEISRGLKSIARELNIPIIALSQLSRAVEAQNPPIPRLSHLRESGSIEQDADVVMFIYREEYYNKESERKNIADLIIAKHRNGPTGQIQLYFDVERASFKNLEKKQDFGPPPPEAI